MTDYLEDVGGSIVDILLGYQISVEERESYVKSIRQELLTFGLATMHSQRIQKELMNIVNAE